MSQPKISTLYISPQIYILGITSIYHLFMNECHFFRILTKFSTRYSFQSPYIDDIDMKLVPVTKLVKRNKTASKNLTMTSFREIVISLPFFQFTANLEPSDFVRVVGKLMFPSTVTFYITKTENKIKKSLT